MSCGKRIAKRSIIGTRVCAANEDGLYYTGVIQAIKSPQSATYPDSMPQTYAPQIFTVRFDNFAGKRAALEFSEADLIGPGFKTIASAVLRAGQKVFITWNGRETFGNVVTHNPQIDEVVITIFPTNETSLEVIKRLDEVRLMESRKSVRLMDQDTDFARLADVQIWDRKRQMSHNIEVPQGSRKRRTSSNDELEANFSDDEMMMDVNAALVLMSLQSSSPTSHNLAVFHHELSPSSSVDSWRSASPSPPPTRKQYSDEGIDLYFGNSDDEAPSRGRVLYRCTWPGCHTTDYICARMERHVRDEHIAPRTPMPHEEEFYYTEIELGEDLSPEPTMSHQDMARPPHEDPEYQQQNQENIQHTPRTQAIPRVRQTVAIQPMSPYRIAQSFHIKAAPIPVPLGNNYYLNQYQYVASSEPTKHPRVSSPRAGNCFPYPSPSSPPALLSLSAPGKYTSAKSALSPSRRPRSESKKCRKVYGMERRDMWCTQCKWKKACTRYAD